MADLIMCECGRLNHITRLRCQSCTLSLSASRPAPLSKDRRPFLRKPERQPTPIDELGLGIAARRRAAQPDDDLLYPEDDQADQTPDLAITPDFAD